jgi:hypothetical protein
MFSDSVSARLPRSVRGGLGFFSVAFQCGGRLAVVAISEKRRVKTDRIAETGVVHTYGKIKELGLVLIQARALIGEYPGTSIVVAGPSRS